MDKKTISPEAKLHKFHWKNLLRGIVQLYLLYTVLGLLILFVSKDLAVLHPLQDETWKPQLAQMDKLFQTRSKEIKIPLSGFKGSGTGYLSACLVQKPGSDKLIIVSHGNAGNLGHRLGLASLLASSGASVLLYDYQGYGESSGTASCNNLLSDGLTVFDYAVALHYKPQNIIIYGESVGCGVTTYIMQNRPAGKVILQSGFTSLSNAARDKLFFLWVLPPSLIPQPNFDNLKAVQMPHPPLLIMHGDKDEILPFRYSETMFEKALPPKEFHLCHNEGHNDIGMKDARGFMDTVKKFVSENSQTGN